MVVVVRISLPRPCGACCLRQAASDRLVGVRSGAMVLPLLRLIQHGTRYPKEQLFLYQSAHAVPSLEVVLWVPPPSEERWVVTREREDLLGRFLSQKGIFAL